MSTEPASNKKLESCNGRAKDAQVVANVQNDIEKILQAGGERQAAERRLVRKLDFRLLPTIIVIFLMNYIDRAAVASARLKGLQTDLGMSDIQYDTVIAILYVSYCPAQIPSNMILNAISRPSIYISLCVILWGLTSALTGVTHNWAGIMACRVFIGLPEAAFYPGSIYLLSRWYTREELTLRSAILVAGLLISIAFGSLWAAGVLGSMNGLMGIAAWRWLFYIEGSITIFIGLLSMWLLPDYPHNTKWLTPEERHLAQVRISEDAGETDKDSKEASVFEGLKLALRDPKVLIFMLAYCAQVLGFSFANFFPTLTATLGYSTTVTLLMAAPPWFLAAIATVINARHADITGERFFHINGWLWVSILGCIVSLSTMKTGARYFSLFLMTAGECAIPVTLVWVANSFPRPPGKRAVAIALVNGFGNLGNLMGAYVWRAAWGPKYHSSMIIVICAFALSSLLCFVIRMMLIRENKRMSCVESGLLCGAERERVEEVVKLEGMTFEEAVRRRMEFRYLY